MNQEFVSEFLIYGLVVSQRYQVLEHKQGLKSLRNILWNKLSEDFGLDN